MLDVISNQGHVILPGKYAVVTTGHNVVIPSGSYGIIVPVTGLLIKYGVEPANTVMTESGELKVVVFNRDTRNPYVIKPGYRVAQMVLIKIDN
jgi:dUTP pyrophosphatase